MFGFFKSRPRKKQIIAYSAKLDKGHDAQRTRNIKLFGKLAAEAGEVFK
jgi:hypothetical protein